MEEFMRIAINAVFILLIISFVYEIAKFFIFKNKKNASGNKKLFSLKSSSQDLNQDHFNHTFKTSVVPSLNSRGQEAELDQKNPNASSAQNSLKTIDNLTNLFDTNLSFEKNKVDNDSTFLDVSTIDNAQEATQIEGFELVNTPLKKEIDLADAASFDERLSQTKNIQSTYSKNNMNLEELISIRLVFNEGRLIHGYDLLELLKKSNLEFGYMKIFHKIEEDKNQNYHILYSIANGYQPGNLIPEEVQEENWNTDTIVFFMSMNSYEPIMAYDEMMSLAFKYAKLLDATLYNSDNEEITKQLSIYIKKQLVNKVIEKIDKTKTNS